VKKEDIKPGDSVLVVRRDNPNWSPKKEDIGVVSTANWLSRAKGNLIIPVLFWNGERRYCRPEDLFLMARHPNPDSGWCNSCVAVNNQGLDIILNLLDKLKTIGQFSTEH